MMRQIAYVLAGIAVFVAAGCYLLGAGYVNWGANSAAAAGNTDPRVLTPAETAAFLPLVCAPLPANAAVSAFGSQYAHRCGALPGYPDTNELDDENDITLTSTAYGHFTDAASTQAYVSYQGSFEAHVTNFGGGILFQQTGGVWALLRWYPGGQIDGCLQLNPQGQAKLLCSVGYFGQGEAESALWMMNIPPNYKADGDGSGYMLAVIKADDSRQSIEPESNCGERKSADEAVLLSIDSLSRASAPEIFAQAGVTYVPAVWAAAACKAGNFAKAKTSAGVLRLIWDGKTLRVQADEKFAKVVW